MTSPHEPAEPAAAIHDRRHPLALVLRLPAVALLGAIKLYQRTLSPALPVLTMGRCGCRFSPTCSHYAAEAIRTHGAWAGLGLALARLIKCTPLHPGGFDPVPPRAPRCARVTALSSSL
jgi:putative membrane protein insertion efficiency factor